MARISVRLRAHRHRLRQRRNASAPTRHAAVLKYRRLARALFIQHVVEAEPGWVDWTNPISGVTYVER